MNVTFPHTEENLTNFVQTGSEIPGPPVNDAYTAFIGRLVDKDLVSLDLIKSGDLEMFDKDTATEWDALAHILVGDENGGAHHLRTIMKLEVGGRQVGSKLRDKVEDPIDMALEDKQRIQKNGTYRPRLVRVEGKDKLEGSTMFPDEWPTEKVIKSIVATAKSVPTKHDLERSSYMHRQNIDGVRVNVVTDEKTGKIITASPMTRG